MSPRRSAALTVVLASLVACDAEAPRERGSPSAAPRSQEQPAAARPIVRTRIPVSLNEVPRTDVGLPPRLPRGDEQLPSLLDDPPGRAVMAYRPVERLDDPEGWAGETTYLLGADGRWRRLELVDLELTEEWWPGPDMYGPGQVSPDGRWWAAHAGPHVVLLDLRSSRLRIYPVGDGRSAVRFVDWLPDSGTLQAYSSGTADAPHFKVTHLVGVDGRVRVSPYDSRAVGFQPDGTAVRFGQTHVFRWATEDAAPTKQPTKGIDNMQARSWMAHHGDELSIVAKFREGEGLDDLLAVVPESLEPVARLVNRRGGYEGRGESLGISYGWLDANTLLTSTSSWIVTWEPLAGELRRVVRTPRVPPNVWASWSASFALDLLEVPADR